MTLENSLRNVFRFVQLRPTTIVPRRERITLKDSTSLAAELARAEKPERRGIALKFLRNTTERFSGADSFLAGEDVLASINAAVEDEDVSVGNLQTELQKLELGDDEALEGVLTSLSDLLLAITFVGPDGARLLPGPHTRETLVKLYQGYALAASDDLRPAPTQKAYRILDRPLALPSIFQQIFAKEGDAKLEGTRGHEVEQHPAAPGYASIETAISDLKRLERPKYLYVPADEDDEDRGVRDEDDEVVALEQIEGMDLVGESQDEDGEDREVRDGDSEAAIGDRPVAFSLTDEALARLSDQTQEVLTSLELKHHEMSLDQVVTALEHRIETGQKPAHSAIIRAARVGVAPKQIDGTLATDTAAYVHQAGIADLLVVKQQIKRYEAAEIAHVENIMKGETRSRTHRLFNRREEALFTETERTVEEEEELETADRFELNRETERTLKKDRKLGFELSLSGKYGPTVEFSSNLSMEASQASEESSKNASTFAQEVVERSLSKIIERVKESRTLTLIRESEETNLHSFKNDDPAAEHVVGIYQFLEKIYEAQVFNYGLRQMFDFMVPEPASFLWHVEGQPSEGISLPKSPVPLSAYVSDWSHITPADYKRLEIRYGAEEIPPPPPSYISVTTSVNHGTGTESESGQPRSFSHTDVEIPEGYKPIRARATAQAFTDNHPYILVQIGHQQDAMNFTPSRRYSLSKGNEVGRMTRYFNGTLTARPLAEGSQLGIDVYGYETATYSVQVEITCERQSSHYSNWQKAAYKKLAEAYEARVREYELRVEELEAEARTRTLEQDFGESPSIHLKLILTELKKHCISIITRQWYDAFSATLDEDPPRFDFAQALAEGRFIRFFEQAFEWDQLQYVFYPYYWARKSTWIDRFLHSEVDPIFQEFLQSGSARVVVPVRPGFEIAVNHFMETGNIWNGEGSPPAIGSPTYVSIVEEIMERTGAPQDEVPVGEPWDVRLPTPLVLLKEKRSLPEWVREATEGWTWTPALETDDDDSG